MAKHVLIILRHPPYGRLDAAEAVRHLNGAAAYGLDATLLLVEDGVYLAKAGQDPASGWIDLAAALTQAVTSSEAAEGARGKSTVYARAQDVRRRGLCARDLAPGCQIVDELGLTEALASADATFVY